MFNPVEWGRYASSPSARLAAEVEAPFVWLGRYAVSREEEWIPPAAGVLLRGRAARPCAELSQTEAEPLILLGAAYYARDRMDIPPNEPGLLGDLNASRYRAVLDPVVKRAEVLPSSFGFGAQALGLPVPANQGGVGTAR